jgi:hypothetical protein
MGDYKPIFEKLLETKRKKMEEECGLSLYPTYSFFRMYTLYSDLKKHTDRPSCEISATVCLGGDKTEWPIYIEGNAVSLDPGDAVIYLGCDLQHWREKFLGDWQAQCFLHWVDANGKYKHHKNDNVLKTTGKQQIIKEKGGLRMTAESLKHFSNVLVSIAVGLNRNFDEKTKNLLTFDDTKIEGK